MIQDFDCERCGHLEVKTKFSPSVLEFSVLTRFVSSQEGNGYTNHCSQCLWSKHVDINPGDRSPEPSCSLLSAQINPNPRLAECQGMMEPVVVENKKQSYRIFQRCVDCGHERWNKAQVADCFETILDIASGDGNFTSRPVACVE